MIMNPCRRPKDDINGVWDKMGWPVPTSFYRAFYLAGKLAPYERFDVKTEDWQIIFSPDVGTVAERGTLFLYDPGWTEPHNSNSIGRK